MTFKCFIYTNNIANTNKSDALEHSNYDFYVLFTSFYILISILISSVLTNREGPSQNTVSQK